MKKKMALELFAGAWVKLANFVSLTWYSIIFRIVLLLLLNVVVYFLVEWWNKGMYGRFKIFVLIVNMVLMLIFLPSLHITRESINKSLKVDTLRVNFSKNYVMIVTISIMIILLLAMSVYLVPYFFLTTDINVSKGQKFIYIFLVVFVYMMLFLSYGDKLTELYKKIQGIPFIPNETVVDAILNMFKYAILYILVCIPIDVFNLCKDIILGRFGFTGVLVLSIVLIIFLFLVVYGKKIKDGTFKFNDSLTVLRKDELYLNSQTNLGFYDDVIKWDFADDDVLRETVGGKSLAILKPGNLEPVLSDEELNGANVSILNGWWGDNISIPRTLREYIDGKIGYDVVLDRMKNYVHDDIYFKIKAWLISPDVVEMREKQGVVGTIGDEGYCNKADALEVLKEDGEEVEGDVEKGDDLDRRRRYDILRMSDRIHRINYSLSMWFYIAPLTENYINEMTILNFSNKVVISLGRDGTVIYVDVDVDVGERDLRGDMNVNKVKNKRLGRVRKRVFALDTFAHQRWNHLAITTDHVGRMNAFMNGILVATNEDVMPDLEPKNRMIYVGEKRGAKGMLKYLYYYNKVLTKTDVTLLYNKMHLLV